VVPLLVSRTASHAARNCSRDGKFRDVVLLVAVRVPRPIVVTNLGLVRTEENRSISAPSCPDTLARG